MPLAPALPGRNAGPGPRWPHSAALVDLAAAGPAAAYHAAHRMFERVNAGLGADWTLHDLRHTAAYRMSRDPRLPLVDVQWVLGHASLTTTQIYLPPTDYEVIQNVLAHHAQTEAARAERAAPPPAPGYQPEHLDLLFGRGSR
ncbi:site-specific integrase [Streptomyces sp. NPDC086783]|uniref:site-specific integrase n=1 Tax=Streptomyces sp. NPDC086783 TaxID=3365758 RepID=UPI0037F7E607